MAYVVVIGRRTEPDLDGDHPAVLALHDDVDLAVGLFGSQVAHLCRGCGGIDAQALGDQRLEQRSEPGPGRRAHPLTAAFQHPGLAHPDEPSGQRWVDQVMLRRERQSLQWVERRSPRGHWIQDEDPAQMLAMVVHGQTGRLVDDACRSNLAKGRLPTKQLAASQLVQRAPAELPQLGRDRADGTRRALRGRHHRPD